MRAWRFAQPGETLRVLCLGAHSDDIEIGAGGAILSWIASGVRLHVNWCVASAPGEREEEARRSAAAFLDGAASVSIEIGDFKDSFFPYHGERIKNFIRDYQVQLQTGHRPDAPGRICLTRTIAKSRN